MSYTDDAVLAKLSALNETQESIVTVAQWVMFHRYDRIIPTWTKLTLLLDDKQSELGNYGSQG